GRPAGSGRQIQDQPRAAVSGQAAAGDPRCRARRDQARGHCGARVRRPDGDMTAMPIFAAPMRPFALAVALLLAVANATAQDFPRLKAGLWPSLTTTQGREKGEPRPALSGLDDSVQRGVYHRSVGLL